MSNQHEPSTEAPTDASSEGSTPIESHSPTEKRVPPSQYQVAMMIADHLGEKDEAKRKHILSLVRALGRTQAQAFLAETERQGTIRDGEPIRTASEVFCDLAYNKGRLVASLIWGQDAPRSKSVRPLGNKAVARRIAKRLGETSVSQNILLKHVVGALGQVQAWALMIDALEIEAHGGMMILNGERRRTVGGVFLYIASTRGKLRPGKVLRRYSTPKNETSPEKSLPENENTASSD
jgi:hypothetical protein